MSDPIIIVGAPRSGTSILGRIFARHPDLAYSNEPRLVWRYGNDSKSDMLVSEDANPKTQAYIRNYFDEFVDRRGKQRLLEKTPSNALRLDFIRSIYPNCKMIHILRNGYDSVLSIRDYWIGNVSGLSYKRIDSKEDIFRQRLLEMHVTQMPYYACELVARIVGQKTGLWRALWGPRLPGMQKMLNELGVLAVSSVQWRMCVELACHSGRVMDPNLYREVRLEELTVDGIRELFDFCELAVTPEVSDYFENHFEAQNGPSRRHAATNDEMKEMDRYIGSTMSWLGYAR